MQSTTTCTYTNKTCGYGTCTLPTHYWQWGSSTCHTVQSTTSVSQTLSQYDSSFLILGIGFTLFAFGFIVWHKAVKHFF